MGSRRDIDHEDSQRGDFHDDFDPTDHVGMAWKIFWGVLAVGYALFAIVLWG